MPDRLARLVAGAGVVVGAALQHDERLAALVGGGGDRGEQRAADRRGVAQSGATASGARLSDRALRPRRRRAWPS